MDAVSSATLVVSPYPLSGAMPGAPPKSGASFGQLTLRGVALCVPYTIHVAVAEADRDASKQLVETILNATFGEAEAFFSPYCHSSELCTKLCPGPQSKAIAGEWFQISRQLFDVLHLAENLVHLSDGLFDPTVVPFGKAYVKEAANSPNRVLSDSHPLVQSAAQVVGWGKVLKIRREPSSVDTASSSGWSYEAWRGHEGVALDPSAISKGYVVDMLVERLRAANFLDLFVDWGGDVRCLGEHPEGRKWTCGIRSVQADNHGTAKESAPFAMYSGDAACTSGDYFQFDSLTKYHHMTDPTKLKPLLQGELGSVTLQVEGGSCAWCDGLTTAAFLVLNARGDDALRDFIARANAVRPATRCVRAVLICRGDGQDERVREVCVAPRAGPSGALASSLSGASKSHLRLLIQTLPQLVTVLFVPLQTGDGSFLAYAAATLTSVVLCNRTAGYFFLQQPSAMADALTAWESSDAIGKPPLQLGVLGSMGAAAQAAADDFSRGKVVGREVVAGYQAEQKKQAADGASMPSNCFAVFYANVHLSQPTIAVGDHVFARVLVLEASDVAPGSFLMRAHRKYLSVSAPRGGLQEKHVPPRCACVTTVSVVTEDGSLALFLGTVLYGVDMSSRSPVTISAAARSGPVTSKLFGAPSKEVKRSEAEKRPDCQERRRIVVARLHFLRDCSDTKTLVDWFADVRCDNVDTQFMYIGKPSLKSLRNVSLGESVPAVIHVDYLFPPQIQLGFLDCVFMDLLPLDGASAASVPNAQAPPVVLSLIPVKAESSSVVDVASSLCPTETRI